MTETVREIAQNIVRREGGFVNDPDDPGGATKHGVTIGTMRRLGIDLNDDGDVDVDDVRRVDEDLAVDLFLKHYYFEPGIDELPNEDMRLRASVFDMQVNAGSNAVKILQRLVTRMGYKTSVDGIIGPKTLKAVKMAARDAPDHITDAYGVARRNYYFRLADKRPKLRKFARTRAGGKGGWIKRAEEFISQRFHMSDEEFQRRVAKWG